jgi:hypothetical protein
LLLIGALLVDPAHRVWAGTGEANTSSDSCAGQGVYVSENFGTTYSKLDGTEVDGALIFRLTPAEDGTIFAATSHGLWRHSPSTSGPWQQVFAPDPDPAHSPYRTNFTTDVQVQPQQDGAHLDRLARHHRTGRPGLQRPVRVHFSRCPRLVQPRAAHR